MVHRYIIDLTAGEGSFSAGDVWSQRRLKETPAPVPAATCLVNGMRENEHSKIQWRHDKVLNA